jgi:hypothetical protein
VKELGGKEKDNGPWNVVDRQFDRADDRPYPIFGVVAARWILPKTPDAQMTT